MEFRDLVESRVIVRQFAADPVPVAHVRGMVRLASLAPSPNNSQPWQFVAVSRSSLLKQMAAAVREKVDAMRGQPDVQSQGWLFSMVVVYCMNLLTLALTTVALSKTLDFVPVAELCGRQLLAVYGWMLDNLIGLWHRLTVYATRS